MPLFDKYHLWEHISDYLGRSGVGLSNLGVQGAHILLNKGYPLKFPDNVIYAMFADPNEHEKLECLLNSGYNLKTMSPWVIELLASNFDIEALSLIFHESSYPRDQFLSIFTVDLLEKLIVTKNPRLPSLLEIVSELDLPVAQTCSFRLRLEEAVAMNDLDTVHGLVKLGTTLSDTSSCLLRAADNISTIEILVEHEGKKLFFSNSLEYIFTFPDAFQLSWTLINKELITKLINNETVFGKALSALSQNDIHGKISCVTEFTDDLRTFIVLGCYPVVEFFLAAGVIPEITEEMLEMLMQRDNGNLILALLHDKGVSFQSTITYGLVKKIVNDNRLPFFHHPSST
eukprot:TRINITY_DN9195_c0_g1_i6.p1 TRINITY_DN9195_c0_g1~~TRINITY_DN9195_c0_g1_i6.p1  ORF type:complete len:344 (-),score=59.00 TRINITY_DN9195_c0_g1_i6:75-1106(-)